MNSDIANVQIANEWSSPGGRKQLKRKIMTAALSSHYSNSNVANTNFMVGGSPSLISPKATGRRLNKYG